jgi:Ca-activated chloride channel family protein
LLPALAAAFEQPEDQERHRMVIILTDGAVQDFEPSRQLLEQKLGAGRLFVVGIGEDVREENILRMTEYGRGTAAFARDPQGLELAVVSLFDSVSDPLAWDLEMDWGGADAEVMGAQRLPDLYAGRPVTIFARVRGPLPSEVMVLGQTMNGVETFSAVLTEPPADEPSRTLPQPPRGSSSRSRGTAKSGAR